MAEAGVQLAQTVAHNFVNQQRNGTQGAPPANTRRLIPNLAKRDLLTGDREKYITIGVPLYEASIKCDWKAANAILIKNPELVRYCITENGETPLHVAVSAKGRKNAEEFVKNLANLMKKEDFELENENFNTALYLAAAAGKLEMVKIMVGKNKNALIIPGSGQMMPLYAAALFGNYDVVKYLYKNSNELADEDGWTNQNRRWLLEKCVENDMFDVALTIVKTYPKLGTGGVLGILARKPEAFPETKSNFFNRIIKSVSAFIGSKVGVQEKETKALPLLRILWENIAKMPKNEIDKLLRGEPDSVKKDKKSASGRVVEAIQLQKLIDEYLNSLFAGSKDILKAMPAASGKGNQTLQLEKLISEQLVKIHVETQKISGGPPDSNKQDNMTVSGKGDQALELQKLIFEHIVNMHDETQKIIKNSEKADPSPLLHKLIIGRITSMDKETKKIMSGTANTYSSRVLFIAAEMGNTTFLVELIRRYPDLIWKVNDNNQTIFHIAVKHRHEGVYNLLYEIGSMKDMITPLRDEYENNMLHLVGKIAKQKRLEDVSGVALQMQRELLWFKEVKNMIPPSYRERKNKDGLTPHELFTQEHKELVTLGEQWMKDTANQCMVVSALIATMVFAAAFTIPGGYDQNSGIPMFRSKATLIVFVVADAISLFSSSASILMFLSILTSRYAERDFLESLPKKLMLGLATLFLSITTMTVAFGFSFFVLYHKGFLWIPILIGVFAVLPVILYIKLQYSLFVDVIRSTYGSRYLFKPTKHVLYYQNPKV